MDKRKNEKEEAARTQIVWDYIPDREVNCFTSQLLTEPIDGLRSPEWPSVNENFAGASEPVGLS